MKQAGVFCALVCALWMINVVAHAAAPVVLQSKVEVNRASVHLADIFSGVAPEADCEIATAPAPGKSVTYDVRVLKNLAIQYHLDWSPSNAMDKAVISRASTEITLDMVQGAVMEKLGPMVKGENKTIEITFDARSFDLFLPADRAPDFSLANLAYDETTHRFRADVVAQGDGSTITKTVAGRVAVKRMVPVLAHRLPTGTTITAGDLSRMAMNEDRINGDVLTDEEAIVGQELRRNMTDGEPLRKGDVIPPRLVTRNALVMMKVQTPVMLITTQGKSLSDGGKDDTVRVINLQTNRVVEGTVEAAGVVRVTNSTIKVAQTH